MKSSTKEIIAVVAACIAFSVGIGLCIGGFFVPPEGAISGSVLTFFGEVITFFSAVLGISEFGKIQIEKIRRMGNNDKNEENDN